MADFISIRVGELPNEAISLTDKFPHEVGTDLKQATIEDLAILISNYASTVIGVGFRAVTVLDGQTLPTTDKEEFILVGAGTFYNVGGGSTIVLTEELNALISNGEFWTVGVEIPVNVQAVISQTIRSGFTTTSPSEDAIYNYLLDYAKLSDLPEAVNEVIEADDFDSLPLIGGSGKIYVTKDLNEIYRWNGTFYQELAVTDISGKENISNKQNSLDTDASSLNYPTVEAVRTGKVFQDFASYSTYSGLGLNKANSGIILIGDSNSEGYFSAGVDSNNWFNKLAYDIEKNQGKKSGVGFTNLSDLSRYSVTSTGSVSVVNVGPTKTALQMSPNSTIEFDSDTNLVEVWMNTTTTSGKLEFYYNDILYRTVDLSISGNLNNVSSFSAAYPTVSTPSGVYGHYKIKCIDANCVVTALFKKVMFSEGHDTFYFLRSGVSGKSFANFNVNDIRDTYGLGGENNSLFLLNLGTNSIYASSIATTSVQYGVELTSYLTALKTSKSNVVYVMPPKAIETLVAPYLEPYINYYNKAVSVCKSLGVQMIDLNEVFKFIAPVNAYETDGLHYSIAGHNAIAKFMSNTLAKIDINSINRLQEYKDSTPSFLGTVNFLPKKNSILGYSDSIISDNGAIATVNGDLNITNLLPFASVSSTSLTGGIFGYKIKAGNIEAVQVSYNSLTGENKIGGVQSYVFPVIYSGGLEALKFNVNTSATFSSTVTASPATTDAQIPTLGQVKATRPYKVYTALLRQTGTNPPTATVLENTFNTTPTFQYFSTGTYQLVCTDEIIENKTALFGIIDSGNTLSLMKTVTNNSNVAILTYDTSGVLANSLLNNTTIEIRVYL